MTATLEAMSFALLKFESTGRKNFIAGFAAPGTPN